MSNLIRTTINLDQPLYQEMRLYAASQNISLSQLIRQSVAQKLGKNPYNKSILDLAGSLCLGGKKMPARSAIYQPHVKRKLGL